MNIVPVFIPHAGCPHQCLFCAQDKSSGRQTVPAPADVEQFLDAALPQQGDGEVAFYGGTFTMLPEQQQEAYLGVVQPFINQSRASSIRVSTRPDAVSGESLQRLKRSGVKTIELGCQSFSDDVLESSGRGHTAADNADAVRRCQKAGFHVGIQLMPGLPGDSADSAMRSLRRAIELQPSFSRIYPAVVIAGTGLESLWQSGEFKPWSLTTAVDFCAEMLLACHEASIPIVRMGLQQDRDLQENVLAGPFHPAFGQLVRSRLWQRLMSRAAQFGDRFAVNHADLSDVNGHRGENRSWLTEQFRGCRVTVDNNVNRETMRVAGQNLSLFDQAHKEHL